MFIKRQNCSRDNMSAVFEKCSRCRRHRRSSLFVVDKKLRLSLTLFVTNKTKNFATETADEAINKHIDRGCSLKAYKSTKNRWVISLNMSHIIWVISYHSYGMSHLVCKLNIQIFTCMFVTLETIAKIRNRNLKGRVSSPSFMVSEKQSWLHPKFHNCGWIGSFLVNQGLVLSNESRDSLKRLVHGQGYTDRRWRPL